MHTLIQYLSGVYYFDVNENSRRINFSKETNQFNYFSNAHVNLDFKENNIL